MVQFQRRNGLTADGVAGAQTQALLDAALSSTDTPLLSAVASLRAAMSFILDALKKAESERSRQSGPVLMDVRIAAPRRRCRPGPGCWAAVLLANLAVLAWLLLRVASAARSAASSRAAAPVAVPAPARSRLPVAGASARARRPRQRRSSTPAATPPAAQLRERRARAYAAATCRRSSHADVDVDSLPTVAGPDRLGITLPHLQLNLHVYEPTPANRYVLLNCGRLREGEFTPDGIRVERITPRGVVLDCARPPLPASAGG